MRSKTRAGYAINLLKLAYLTIGIAVIMRHSVFLGIAYIVLIFLSFLTIAYSWCAEYAYQKATTNEGEHEKENVG